MSNDVQPKICQKLRFLMVRLDKVCLERVYFRKDDPIRPMCLLAMGFATEPCIDKGSRRMTEQKRYIISIWTIRMPMSMLLSRALMEPCGSGRHPLPVLRMNS